MGKARIELKGFDEFYEKLQRVSDNADKVAEKKFDECLSIIESELKNKGQAAGLSSHLLQGITRDTLVFNGSWLAKVGWKQRKAEAGYISDYHKVIFLNYGTPRRKVKTDKQKIAINGDWKTLTNDRGEIMKRGFIKRAKLSSNRKIKTLMKNTLHEMLNKE